MKHPLLSAQMESAIASPLRELTTALARGDDDAWMQFHRDFGPRIFRQLLALTRGDHDLSSEALQQTYLRIARHVRPCDSQPMFLGWLRVVARTALSDARRRRRTFWQLLARHRDQPDAPRDSGTEEEDRLQAALATALDLIDAGDRALLEMKYFSGASVKNIAEQLGLSPKAVESRLTRARADLRRYLLSTYADHE